MTGAVQITSAILTTAHSYGIVVAFGGWHDQNPLAATDDAGFSLLADRAGDK